MPHRSMTRRSLLKSAAALGPTIIVASALGAEGRPSPSERIAVGAIGVGGRGNADMKTFMGMNDVQVVAVCDVDRRRLEATKQTVERTYTDRMPAGTYLGCRSYQDFRELVDRPDVDAVLCATPDHWHALVSLAAMKAGKDVYCEKPMAATIAEGRAVANAQKLYGRVFQTGSQERSRAGARYACQMAVSGRLGKIHTVRVNLPVVPHERKPEPAQPVPEGFDYDTWLGPAPYAPYHEKRCHGSFRWNLDYSDGELTDRGAHVGDLAMWGNGSDRTGPVSIDGIGVFPKEGFWNTANEFRIEHRFANGRKMIWESAAPRGVTFIGDEGWIFYSVHEGYLQASHPSLLKVVFRPEELTLYESNNHHRNFIECVKSRAETICPAEVGHRSASMCHLGNISMLLGRKLTWDPVKEEFPGDPTANHLISRPMRAPWRI